MKICKSRKKIMYDIIVILKEFKNKDVLYCINDYNTANNNIYYYKKNSI